ncbi:hypothetical protein ACEPAI_5970 [Sanghuangporus weigelae]
MRIFPPALFNSMSSPSGDLLSKPFLGEPHIISDPNAQQSAVSLFEVWNASRQTAVTSEEGKDANHDHLQPGTPRKCNLLNISLAITILQQTFLDMLLLLWGLNPVRTTALIFLTLVRGVLPAFRGYSQALILDELQVVVTSGDYASARLGRLMRLVLRECCRMLAESLFDTFANHNENIVHSSMRFYVEHRQLEQRLRLDLPTLSDPTVRDLLHESDLFVRSFTGLGFGFGLFSPLDLVRALSSVAELVSQLIILYSASRVSSSAFFAGFFAGPSDNHSVTHLPLLGAVLLPSLLSFIASFLPRLPFSYADCSTGDALYSSAEAREAERAERMRSMAHAEPFRAEIALFGLAPWILDSWSVARKRILGLEVQHGDLYSGITLGAGLRWLLTQANVSEMLVLLQNLPFFIYSSTTSLGSLALYRNSVHSLLFNVRSLICSFERAFQSIFYMGAFFAAMNIEPRLNPEPGRAVKYESTGKGMKIEARHISYTYPGSTKPTLKDVNFTVEAGETLVIVGYNGSGKTTLSNVLLRIFDFDAPSLDKPAQLLIDNIDIRRIAPAEYHRHVTALFQVFSKLNATVRENVGIGELRSQFRDHPIREAAARAGAGRLINSLPRGLDTNLDCMGLGMNAINPNPFMGGNTDSGRQGLSGGEWQRVAISRAFMRARSADLLLLDEPTSHLDAHAQNNVLETVESICRDPGTGKRTKTVIIITHQLSIAKRADKIAMFENGTITEFGTHEELMSRADSHYASLYRATVC